MSNTSETENNMSVCANCGRGEENSSNLKSCAACKLVKYCSRECQIAHRPQHKKACKKRAAELHDEELFKQPPPLEDCPICFVRLPILGNGKVYVACCGKQICRGCTHAFQSRAAKAGSRAAQRKYDKCPFCRTPSPGIDSDEIIMQYKQRMELNDPIAISNMGGFYANGKHRLPQNDAKALELWHRAGDLGCADSLHNISVAYLNGSHGVEVNMKQAIHYINLAAIRGHSTARHNLGSHEVKSRGNLIRGVKHFMIAVESGGAGSLEAIRYLHSKGLAKEEDYAKALRSYQAYVDEVKSDQRDEAAAFKDEWKYY